MNVEFSKVSVLSQDRKKMIHYDENLQRVEVDAELGIMG